jgi:hypothetical protein
MKIEEKIAKFLGEEILDEEDSSSPYDDPQVNGLRKKRKEVLKKIKTLEKKKGSGEEVSKLRDISKKIAGQVDKRMSQLV